MNFTWDAYVALLKLLKEKKYEFTNYHEYNSITGNCVILRHDIDNSIEKAYEMALLESKAGVKSTYFVMLTSEFYNVAAARNTKFLLEMKDMGHEIGLHYDETVYNHNESDIKAVAERERTILESVLQIPINTISMHRPSKEALESDWKFENMINRYSKEFFVDFKYVSDSRRCWRESIENIICSHEHNRLHVLTHAFWYENEEKDIKRSIEEWLLNAPLERWDILKNNLKSLDEIISKHEIKYKK